MQNLLKIFIIMAFVLSGCKMDNKSNIDKQSTADDLIQKIQLVALNNEVIRLDEYKGKIIFINFWATWCKPCVEEMASIEKAQSLMNDKEIVFLLASSEGIEEIKEFSRNHNYKFNYVHLENGEALNIQALPTTFIINPKGRIVFSEMGSRNWDETANINLIKNINNQHD